MERKNLQIMEPESLVNFLIMHVGVHVQTLITLLLKNAHKSKLGTAPFCPSHDLILDNY